jgi:hypothetical protein
LSASVSVERDTESLIRGTHDRKVGRVSRHSFYVRFLLIVAVLAMAAIMLGADPWGPI